MSPLRSRPTTTRCSRCPRGSQASLGPDDGVDTPHAISMGPHIQNLGALQIPRGLKRPCHHQECCEDYGLGRPHNGHARSLCTSSTTVIRRIGTGPRPRPSRSLRLLLTPPYHSFRDCERAALGQSSSPFQGSIMDGTAPRFLLHPLIRGALLRLLRNHYLMPLH